MAITSYKYGKIQDVVPDNIPIELRTQKRWMVWGAQPNGDSKPKKRPVDYRTGRYGSYTDTEAWQTFDDAAQFAKVGSWAGVMFILTPDCPYTGVDLDNCLDDAGQFLSPLVEAVVKGLGSYAEVSPSGKGVKAIIRGKVQDLHRNSTQRPVRGTDRLQDIEVYDNKPWTFTGLKLPFASPTVDERTKELNSFYLGNFGSRKSHNDSPACTQVVALTDLAHDEKTLVIRELTEALKHIDSESYETWRDIGFSLKHAGNSIGDEAAKKLWDDWSKGAPNYKENEIDYQWDKFHGDSGGMTIGTVFHLAKESGYELSETYKQFLGKRKDASDVRPKVPIPVGHTELSETARQLGGLMGPSDKYFLKGDALVTVVSKGGREHLRRVDAEKFRSCVEDLAQMGSYRKPRKQEDGDLVWEPKRLTTNDAASIIKASAFLGQIPEISIVVNCPVLVERDGGLVEVSGYDKPSGIYSRGKPTTEMTLKEAVALIDQVFCDYEFVTPNDKSRAIAGLLSPAITFGRLLGERRSPIDLTEADLPQAGKGLRANLIARIYNEVPTAVVQKNGGVGSFDESFGNAVAKGNPFILIDNVRNKLSSQILESFATERTAPVRVFGKEEVHVDPSRYIIYVTSNAARGERDLAQRVCPTSIRKRPDDCVYKVYPEGDISEHVTANQAKYLGAVHAIVREWHRRGKQTKPVAIRNSFSRWYGAMEYILTEIMGGASVFDGVIQTMERLADPLLPWIRELAIEIQKLGRLGEELTANEILGIIEEAGMNQGWTANPYDLGDDAEREKAFKTLGGRLGKVFGVRNEIQVDAYTVTRSTTTDDSGRERKKYTFLSKSMQKPLIPKGSQTLPEPFPEQIPNVPKVPKQSTIYPTGKNILPAVDDLKCDHSGAIGGFVREVRGVWEEPVVSVVNADGCEFPKQKSHQNSCLGKFGGIGTGCGAIDEIPQTPEPASAPAVPNDAIPRTPQTSQSDVGSWTVADLSPLPANETMSADIPEPATPANQTPAVVTADQYSAWAQIDAEAPELITWFMNHRSNPLLMSAVGADNRWVLFSTTQEAIDDFVCRMRPAPQDYFWPEMTVELLKELHTLCGAGMLAGTTTTDAEPGEPKRGGS